MGVEDVAGEHRDAVAEFAVQAHLVAARIRVVDDVVVHEGGRVEDFHGAGQCDERLLVGRMRPGRGLHGARREEHERRSYPLAGDGERVLDDPLQDVGLASGRGRLTGHPLHQGAKPRVHRFHFLRDR